MPKVSVILTIYNQAEFVRDAVSSVLGQSFTDLELIAVDDGSEDDSFEILASFSDPRLRRVRQKNRGVGAARNRGFKLCKGAYVNFLDGDDYFGPEKLARQVEVLDSSPEIGLVFCDVIMVGSDGRPLSDYTVKSGLRPFSENLLAALLAGGFMPPHAVLMRREVFQQVGMFEEDRSLAGNEDYDLWLRVAAEGHRAFFVDAKDAYYRIHGHNISLDQGRMSLSRQRVLVRVTKKYPERIATSLDALQSIQRDLHVATQFLHATVREREAELVKLRTQLEAAQAKISVAEQRAGELAAWTTKKDAHIRHLASETEKLVRLLDEAAAERSQAQHRLNELLAAQAAGQQRIASLERGLQEKALLLQQLQGRERELLAAGAKQEEQLQRLGEELRELHRRREEASAERSCLEQRVGELLAAQAAGQQRIASLEERLREKTGEVVHLQCRLQELGSRNAAQEEQIRRLTLETQTLIRLLEQASSQREHLQQSLADLRAATAAVEGKVRSLEQRLEEQVAELERTRSAKAALELQLRGAIEQAERFQRDLASSQEELAAERRASQSLEAERQGLQSRIDELAAWAAKQAQHIDELANWTGVQDRENRALRMRVKELGEALAARIRSRDELAHALWNRSLRVRLRRGLHGLLDRLQAVFPERVRAAVRPVYLPVYRSLFPQGKPQVPAFAASKSTPAVETPAPAAAEPAAPAAPSAVAFPCPPRPQPALWTGYWPRVSVVLPVWNQARLLGESIRSVLDQTYRNLELIVVDDGSEEDLEAVFRSFSHDHRLRVVRRSHEGLPQALSAGFWHASGELFTWTSADNLMKPSMLATLVDFMLRNPDVEMTYGDMDLIDDQGKPLFDSDYRRPAQRTGRTNELRLPRSVETLGLLADNFIGACFLYRSRAGRAIGAYDSAMLGTEDYDYWLRISLIGRIAHVDSDECLYSYRVHTDCLSGRHAERIAGHAQELIVYHQERCHFHNQRFEILAQLREDSRGWFRTITELTDVLSADGHHVTIAYRAEESEAWLRSAEGERAAIKRAVIRLDPTAPYPQGSQTFVFLAHEDPPAGADPYLTWVLCESAEQARALPPALQQNWTVLPKMRFRYQQELALCRKARDNRFTPWDFQQFREPLVLCLGPLDDDIIDWELLGRLITRYPDWTFLFVANSQAHSTDPRSRLTRLESVHYLGWKRVQEWPMYLSRAALLLMPFRDCERATAHVWDVMVTYLAAGKPILATEVLAKAGFQDAPNTFVASAEAFPATAREALNASTDLALTDRYLETVSPQFLTRQLIGIASTRLHFHRTRRTAQRGAPAVHSRKAQRRCVLETASLDKGGLERVVANMAIDLRAHGWRPSIVVTERDGQIGQQCRVAGIPVHFIKRDPGALKAVLENEKADLLVVHYSNLGPCVAWRLGIPVVSVVHNSYIWSDAAFDQEVRRADLYIKSYVAVSTGVKRYFCRKYGVSLDKVLVIPNGINISDYEKALAERPIITRATLGLAPDDVVLLNVAFLIGTKAQVHAVKAVQEASERCPRLRLLLVGAAYDRNYAAEVSRAIEESGLGARVLLCGETDRVADYYRLADGFLLSSLTEGWSLAMTEAMYFQLPLILTDVGGASDVIENGDIGILVPPAFSDPLEVSAANLWDYCTNRSPRNLDALAAAVVELHDELDLWKQKAKAGRRKVLERYDQRLVAERYQRCFEEVVYRHHGHLES
ncbi:MAG: glycosyltransferase [Armatimonadetes bacterium]|nr:glycosyltransferase [Armatimonadota bacterium]